MHFKKVKELIVRVIDTLQNKSILPQITMVKLVVVFQNLASDQFSSKDKVLKKVCGLKFIHFLLWNMLFIGNWHMCGGDEFQGLPGHFMLQF